MNKTLKTIVNMLTQNRLFLIWFIGLALVSYYVCVYDNDSVEGFVGSQAPLNNAYNSHHNPHHKMISDTPSTNKNKQGKCGNLKEATKKCTQCSGVDGQPLLPVLEPMFNMREMCKQIILLEDHLFQTSKRCEDCICKHFLTIEALAEEAVTLDKEGKYKKYLENLPDRVRTIQKQYVNKEKTIHEVAQELRKIRKEMMTKSFKFGL